MKAVSLLCMLLLVSPLLHADKVIHREKSLYRNILVTQKADRRCLAFSVKRQRRNQTCMNTREPKKIVFPYVRMTFAGLLANPAPRRAMMVGLGGGTIATVLMELYPDLELDLVEVDEAVVRVAREYFNFTETENARVFVQDGRVFTRRAALRNEQYDLIILDAYTGEYIPEHLMTVEFLNDIRELLTPDGIVVANTFAVSDLYEHESATYAKVYGDFLNFKMSGTGNRVIVAARTRLPDQGSVSEQARLLTPRLEPYSVDLEKFLPYLDRTIDWDRESRPLTDQYSPANLLR